MLSIANLVIAQGASYKLPILWETDEDTPEPVNLTDYTAAMQVRKGGAGGKILLDISSEGEDPAIVITGAAAGELEIDLTPELTRSMPPGVHVYDLELTAPDGTVTRLLQGSATIDAEVTREET